MTGLIINGDDFGMDASCSLAIARAFGLRLITHTSAMANGGYLESAVKLAREGGFLDRVGFHMNLTEGVPLTENIAEIPDFVINGRFHKGYLKAPRPLADLEAEAVYAELTAQAERLRELGVKLSHADSHHYIHTFTYIAPIAARVFRENGIIRVRINRTFDTLERPRITDGRIDNSFWTAEGFETTEHFGRLSDIKDKEIPGSVEIMVHPDLDSSGEIIDRSGWVDGTPVGEPLTLSAESWL